VDVIVCDGFIGNVALKISEGLADAIKRLLQQTLSRAEPKAGNEFWRKAFEDFSRRVDYSETGGAPLLGVKGVCTICHGSSSPRAIQNAIRLTAEFAAAGINEKMEAELHSLDHSGSPKRRATAQTA
jgi:glycerol-3-phosphate acyltransferase PlsX